MAVKTMPDSINFRDTLLKQTILFTLISLSTLNATELLKINNKVVNPACIELMQTSLSENSNVIIKSVVVDACQCSNLAYERQEATILRDGTAGYAKDPNDAYSAFSYKYLGRSSNHIYYLFHEGSIGAYKIHKESVVTDLYKNLTKKVTVIDKIGSTFTPCFVSASIDKDSLTVNTKTFNPSKPTAFQCSEPQISRNIHLNLLR